MGSDFDAGAWAREVFEDGYQSGGAPRPEHKDRTPNDLAGIFHRLGVTKAQAEATWKVLRDVATLTEPEDDAALTGAQSEIIASMLASPEFPHAIRETLGPAVEQVKTQRDLHILAYVFVSAWERM
jgi:hypothetical protein